jgi:nitrate/nitrite-specific signal transduction histidine kinase
VAQISNEQGRAALTIRSISFGTAFAAVAIVLYALVYLQTRAWQVLGAAAGVTLALLCLMQARRLVPRAEFDAAGYWILTALLLAYGSGDLAWTGLGPWHTLGAILLILLVGNLILRRRWRAWLLAAGLYALFACLVSRFEPLPRYDVTQSRALPVFILGITTSLALVLLFQLLLDVRPISIRSRLFVAFVLIVLLPAIAFATVSSVVGFRSGRQQVIDQLESVATIKEAELRTWVRSLQGDLNTVLIGDEVIRWTREVLSPSGDSGHHQAAHDELHERFGQMVEESERLEGLFLMNLDRRVVLSTDRRQEGAIGAPGSQAYFWQGLRGEYVHPASYTLSVGGIALITVRPILDEEGEALGILAGRAGPDTLTEIMLERTGLGETGETYLVTLGHAMLTEPRFPKERWDQTYYVFSEGADAALEEHADGCGSYSNYRGQRVLGAYRWLPDLKLALLAEQAEDEALAATYTSLGINLGVALVAALIAAMISVFLGRAIVVPLGHLADTAVRVAGGEFERTADTARDDEIGALARAFDTMTVRLRDVIGSLEERVRERTEALERRALQLETSTRISREITSILEIDDLLKQVVELIKEAFGYYYVAIFLVDRETGTLVFAAGSGEVGRRLKTRGMRLGIGLDSLNGQVAHTNRAMIVNDVAQDPRYMASELLPLTQAELVVPLRMGQRVAGTLDVQSAESNAFTEEDSRIMQSLGDQVAVAIENARLYQRTRVLAVVEERNRLARELHDSVTQLLYSITLFAEWARRLVRDDEPDQAQSCLDQLGETAQQALREMRLLVFELRPPALEQEGLVGALRERLEAVEERLGVDTRLLVDGAVELPALLEEGLYRIAQEALNNALKHAAATSVTVRVYAEGERVQLEIADNGKGFDPDQARAEGGLGLVSMQERAHDLGGSLSIVSTPGQGATVKVDAEVGQ